VSVDDLLQYDPQATYGAIALDYDYAQQHYWSFATDIALDLAGLAPGMTVLDAGCGTGAATLRAAAPVRPNGRVVAVDFAPEMLALATTSRPYLAPLHDAFYDAARAEAPDLTPPCPWRRTDTAARLAAVFDAARVPAALSDRTATLPLREPDDWWRVVRATGLSRTARLLGPEAAARVAAANLRAIAENGIDALTTQFLFAVARK